MLGNGKGVLRWVPRAHLYFVNHVYFRRVLLVYGVLRLRNDFLSFVHPIGAHVLASLVHEFYVYLTIGQVLYIDYVRIRVISPGQDHARIGRDLQVELVEDVLRLVYFAEFLLEVLCYVQDLARLILLPHVPYLNAQVVARKEVIIVNGREFRP